MDAETLCTCGCPYRRHVARLGRGAVVLACSRCPECEIFNLAVPEPEPLRQPNTLIYAWESWWCPTCGGRTFREGASCCDAPMLPVRLEMHSREPL